MRGNDRARWCVRRGAAAALAVAAGLSAAAAPAAWAGPADPLPEEVVAPASTGVEAWRRVAARARDGYPVLWPDATVRRFSNVDFQSAGTGPGQVLAID